MNGLMIDCSTCEANRGPLEDAAVLELRSAREEAGTALRRHAEVRRQREADLELLRKTAQQDATVAALLRVLGWWNEGEADDK